MSSFKISQTSAFTPLRRQPNNPITTQEHHSEQTSSVVFNPKRGIDFNIPEISDTTHFEPIQPIKPIKTNNSRSTSADLFEPPAIKRTKRDAPMMPDF